MISENGTLLRIYGKVQGSDFGPGFGNWRNDYYKGDVYNDGAGVVVRIVGDASRLLAQLPIDCPPLARIDQVQQFPGTGVNCRRISLFSIACQQRWQPKLLLMQLLARHVCEK